MKRYMKYIKPYWGFFVISPCLMMVEVFCDVQIPALAAQIINQGVSQGSPDQIYALAMEMLAMVLLSIVGGAGAAYAASRAAVCFSCDLRSDLFDKIQTFSFANVDKFSSGSLITRLTNDITQMEQLIIMSLRMMFRAPGMLIGSMIMAFTLNDSLAWIFVVMIPILATIIGVIVSLSYKKFAFLQEKVDGLNQTVREALVNVRVIKGLSREDYEIDKFQGVNGDLKESSLSAYYLSVLQMPMMTLVIYVCTAAILYFGGIELMEGNLSSGDITAFITYATQILMSVNMLSMVFMQSSRAIASSNRICEVLDTNTDLSDEKAQYPEKKVTSGSIVFEDVNFKYSKQNQENILQGLNLSIQAGQTVGIIGSTGSGKTSLVQLIPRLYDVTQGKILVDGTDVRDYSLNNLREGVSVVLQNNLLFSGTISENLQWGDKNATAQDQALATKMAAADEFIQKMPQGYDSYVQQGGMNLSGGQKQRMCIARALLKKPKILIFDDSTSAVDTATEQQIRHYLANDLSGVTKIIIAQRITSVMYADVIVVLNEGEIEMVGTHKELMESSQTYQEVYQSQVNQEVME
ncbi:MAG: ABC transporter ATP-binding protein [Eubacteriales bacterium]